MKDSKPYIYIKKKQGKESDSEIEAVEVTEVTIDKVFSYL